MNNSDFATQAALNLPAELSVRKFRNIKSNTQAKATKEAFLTFLQSNFEGLTRTKVFLRDSHHRIQARACFGKRRLFSTGWNFEDCITKFIYEYNTKVLPAVDN